MSEEGVRGGQTFVVEELAIREGTVYSLKGVLLLVADEELHRVPNELWAWTPSPTTYQRCRDCGFHDDCGHQTWWSRDVRHFVQNV